MSAGPELIAVKLPHREARKSALKTILVYTLRSAAYLLPALGMAVMIKYHYSRAGSEDLRWILLPTARLVEVFSGIHFVEELQIDADIFGMSEVDEAHGPQLVGTIAEHGLEG